MNFQKSPRVPPVFLYFPSPPFCRFNCLSTTPPVAITPFLSRSPFCLLLVRYPRPMCALFLSSAFLSPSLSPSATPLNGHSRESTLCRYETIRPAGGGRGGEWGRAIFQPFDFHFLIAAATEAVAQLRIEHWKFIALFPGLSIAGVQHFLSLGLAWPESPR